MSLESLLRIPVIGYTDWWRENVSPKIQSLDFRSTNQTISWTIENPYYSFPLLQYFY